LADDYYFRLRDMPTAIAFDVETTGLLPSDRIVSFGAWKIETDSLRHGRTDVDYRYLIFDPGRACHPAAERVHGYGGWLLRHQQPFAEHAEALSAWLADADILIAHNLAFDYRFLESAFRHQGNQLPAARRFCTMEAWRDSMPGSASLAAASSHIGLSRGGAAHGAIEDAWLALMLYRFLAHDMSDGLAMPGGAPPRPTNFVDPPNEPARDAPTRSEIAAERRRLKRVSASERKAVLEAARPVGILLAWLAQADGLVEHERVTLAAVVGEVAANLEIILPAQAAAEIAAEILALPVTGNLVTRAVKALLASPAHRALFPRWLAEIARADGILSAPEEAVVAELRQRIAAQQAKA